MTKQNEFMRELLITKAHLIDGSKMPDSMMRFATSTLIFDFYASPSEEGHVPERLKEEPRTKYPIKFDQHVIDTTERLKARIDELHRKYAQPLWGAQWETTSRVSQEARLRRCKDGRLATFDWLDVMPQRFPMRAEPAATRCGEMVE
jgi:hypothetical protein